ncbi:MAG TPA: terminase small subunit, partial [Candidatus Saccharimonadales bacterium]
QRFSEWVEKFKDNEEISDSIKKITDILEQRLVLGGLDTTFNPTMAIFTLKNRHGWRDAKDTPPATNIIIPIYGGLSAEPNKVQVSGHDSNAQSIPAIQKD